MKEAEPGQTRVPRVPEKEIPINPINPCDDTRSAAVQKLSIVSSNLALFVSRLAGSTAFDVLHRVVFFLYFFLRIFVVALFKSANKIMIM